MRVISGFLKSRVILGDNIDGTRPTMDRVKSSLFATINTKLNNSICLDLFAGSGSLGIEAISNGAKKVIFCDNNKKCIEVINKNINNFKIQDYSEVYLGDYLKILNTLKLKNIKFDIIFLDPPYKMDVTDEIFKFIFDNKILKNDGIIILEYSDITPGDTHGFIIDKEKRYGNKFIRIYKCILL